jgi:hypothetical protein
MKIVPAGPRKLELLLSVMLICAVTGCGGSLSSASFIHFSILNTLSLPTGCQGSGIYVQGSLAYISTEAIGSQSGTRSLVIVSLETPTAPTILSETSSGLASDMAGIVVNGKTAYVPFESASGTNFQVWDVSNPRSPSVVGSTSISCPAGMYPTQNPALYGNYVYVSCWESEVATTGAFAIVDVSNPGAPLLAGSVFVTANYQPVSLAIWEQNLDVVATQGGSTSDYALLYSIADPVSPSLIATESIPHSPQWVAAQGAAALIPIYDGKELQVVDFSSPASPQTSSANLGSCHPMFAVVYLENLALATCDSPGGVAEVNLATAGHPAYLGTALIGTVFNFIAVSGSYLFGVDASGNFETIG